MKRSEDIEITLRGHEALVLFDWLVSLSLQGHENEPDAATQKLLWQVEGTLEKHLVEVVDPAYKALLEEAKIKLLAS
ncbi:hypothetical protein [Brevifollis gellanilyticus]|uniref:Uncharacterized protein n=1 Tax=Brevifollis gellanilyticus TaxID=748831 RepID=A0A512MI59_9BACT|nr:hypothetical protein [Brevifollis gellanilyticus]GEP46424.1 hypothetical protein BGE01nite_57150 [Brevifollis gellanilyticus]